MSLSRRGLFSLFARPLKVSGETASSLVETSLRSKQDSPPPLPLNQVAVIQGRHCIALTTYCSLCVERCPEPGAIDSRELLPMIVPDLCTGCGICHQVCPAPTNAVLILPRQRPFESAESERETGIE